MTQSLTEADIEKIRDILNKNPTNYDKEIKSLFLNRDFSVMPLINRYKTQLTDNSISIDSVMSLINNLPAKSPQNIPPLLSIPKENITSTGLPPKMRAKVSNTPSGKNNPFIEAVGIPLHDSRSLSAEFSPRDLNKSIPILPKIALASIPPSKTQNKPIEPKIGSLAVVLHQLLGSAHVCRVLATKIENNSKHYLISFFQSDFSPCYVLGDYLFQLPDDIGFPLNDEAKWKDTIEKEHITVDWLFERLFSAAQVLMIEYAEYLFNPQSSTKLTSIPNVTQSQQIMSQGVCVATFLLLLFISAKWDIPKSKKSLLLNALMTYNTTPYISVKNKLEKVVSLMKFLLELPQE